MGGLGKFRVCSGISKIHRLNFVGRLDTERERQVGAGGGQMGADGGGVNEQDRMCWLVIRSLRSSQVLMYILASPY